MNHSIKLAIDEKIAFNKAKPIKRMFCACCGAVHFGRQWEDQDAGYGLCSKCLPRIEQRFDAVAEEGSLERRYGFRGVNFEIPLAELVSCGKVDEPPAAILICAKVLASLHWDVEDLPQYRLAVVYAQVVDIDVKDGRLRALWDDKAKGNAQAFEFAVEIPDAGPDVVEETVKSFCIELDARLNARASGQSQRGST